MSEKKLLLENVECGKPSSRGGEQGGNGGRECCSSFQHTPSLSPYLLADSWNSTNSLPQLNIKKNNNERFQCFTMVDGLVIYQSCYGYQILSDIKETKGKLQRQEVTWCRKTSGIRWGMRKEETEISEGGLPRAIHFTSTRVGTNRNCLVRKSQPLSIGTWVAWQSFESHYEQAMVSGIPRIPFTYQN